MLIILEKLTAFEANELKRVTEKLEIKKPSVLFGIKSFRMDEIDIYNHYSLCKSKTFRKSIVQKLYFSNFIYFVIINHYLKKVIKLFLHFHLKPLI